MSNPEPIEDNDAFLTQLEDSSNQLVDHLQKNDYENASKIIHGLIEARDAHIFNSVGQLTRALHTAIVNFNVDAEAYPNSEGSEISDATDRLNYVLQLTQQAADKTMDKVEAVTPIASNLGEEAHRIKDEWQKLQRREMSKEEFKVFFVRVGEYLDKMGEGTDQLNAGLQDIILEQGFQDLTGQALKKVITLVTDVEKELVNLMRIAGQVEVVAGLASDEQETSKHNVNGEGPSMNADKRTDVVHGQDEVDDLLSSLGF